MSRTTLSTMLVVAMAALTLAAGPVSAQVAAKDAAKPNLDAILDTVPQGMHLVAIVKNIKDADAKVGKFVMAFMPQGMMPFGPEGPQPMQMLLSELIDDPTLVKPGSPLVFCAKFGGDQMEPTAMLLLDMVDFKAFAKDVDAEADENGLYDVNGLTCAPYKGLTAFFPDPENAAEMIKAPSGIKLRADQKTLWTGNDAFALVDLVGMMKAVTPVYEKQHKKLLDDVARLKADDGGAEEARAKMAQVKMLEKFWSMGRQLDWAALGASLPAAGLDIQLAAAVRPGTDMAAFLDGHAALGKVPGPGLPIITNNWAAFWWSFDGRKVGQAAAGAVSLVRELIGMQVQTMDGDRGPRFGPDFRGMLKGFEKMEKLIRDNADLIPGKGAGALVAGADGTLFNSVGVAEIGDRAAYDKFLASMSKLQEQWLALSMNMTSQPGGAQAMKMDITMQRNVRQIGALSVDLQTMKFKFNKDAAVPGQPDISKMLMGMFGGDTVKTWMTHSGKYMLSQTGETPNLLAKVAEAAGQPGGLAASDDMKALRAHALEDANVIGYVSMATYVNMVMGAVIQAMTQQPVELPPVNLGMLKTKSAFSMAAGRNRLAFRLYMPTEEFKLIVNNVMQMQMQMMNNMRARPMPGGDDDDDDDAQPPVM